MHPATKALRQLFERPGISRVVGAHNALGARLGERAGFDAIWSSGLEVSASHGVPDADILTMTELLTAAQWIAAAVHIPVVADCDAGYGNATNVAHMVRRYETAGIAAVCIEDKPFPKMNSFIPGNQRLVSIAEFAGKLEAAKAARRDPDFMVIGRVEALIAGMGLDEAVRRACAYSEAGADAILIHDKGSSPQPILEFLARWQRPTPVIVVPTTYFRITGRQLEQAGAKMVIYANHGLRASVLAISEVFGEIRRSDGTAKVEDRIAPLSTIFDLQGMPHLKAHDAQYVRATGSRIHAVIPATTDWTGNYELSPDGRPLLSLDIAGRSLAECQTAALRRAGITNVTIALSLGAKHLRADEAHVVVDERWTEDGDVHALLSVCDDNDEAVIVASSDTLFDSRLISRFLHSEHDIVVAVHASHRSGPAAPSLHPVRLAESGDDRRSLDLASAERVVEFAAKSTKTGVEFIGLVRLSPRGVDLLRERVRWLAASQAPGSTGPDLVTALTAVLATGNPIHYIDCPAGWMEIRSAHDLDTLRSAVSS